ncbi:peroxin 23 [Colletotrichum tofieldiae]|nr:peroxin 23 [Colletotrichum tofieldiae]
MDSAPEMVPRRGAGGGLGRRNGTRARCIASTQSSATRIADDEPPGPALTTQRYSTLEEKMVSPTHSAQDLALSDKDLEREKDDAASTLSTSSGGRSFFKAPSLRRKVTDKSVAGKADKEQDRSRRASEAKSEEEASALGLKLNLALQGKDGGQWGIGDEARMSLE